MQIQKLKKTKWGDIPEEWTIKTISDMLKEKMILELQDGNHGELYPRKKDFSTKGRLFLNANCVKEDGTINIQKALRLPEEYCKKLRIGFTKGGDVLFTHNATVGRVAVLHESFEDAVVGTSITYYRLNNNTIDRKYFAYSLQTKHFKSQLDQVMFQTTRMQVPITTQAKLDIIIPPLEEQQIIASILSNVDNLILKTDQVIEQTQRLQKGLMQRVLTKGIGHTKFKKTELGEIPEEWNIFTLINKCSIGSGGTPSRTKPEYYKGDIPWVKTGEINFVDITNTGEHISKEAINESSAKLYKKGTLLVAMYGQGITRGRSAILAIDATINQACAAIQPSDELSNRFLFYWFQMNYEKIRNLSHGTHQSNLNLDYIGSLKIPCPSINEQKKIVFILSNIDNLIQKLKDKKKNEETLKKGLMQQLLTGKIRVKV